MLIVSKPENQNLRHETTVDMNSHINKKKTHSFFANTKLRVDQITKEIKESFKKPFFKIKTNIFNGQNDHKIKILKSHNYLPYFGAASEANWIHRFRALI